MHVCIAFYNANHAHICIYTHADVYIGAIVGGAVLGLLVVLLTVALIVLCTRTRARQKMVMSQDVLGHLTLSQRYTVEPPIRIGTTLLQRTLISTPC